MLSYDNKTRASYNTSAESKSLVTVPIWTRLNSLRFMIARIELYRISKLEKDKTVFDDHDGLLDEIDKVILSEPWPCIIKKLRQEEIKLLHYYQSHLVKLR
jgi:hypothetical protein